MKTNSNRKTGRITDDPCQSHLEDDGVSSKELAKRKYSEARKRSRGKPNHHARQLCKQALHAIDEALICDCGDPLFDDLRVDSVHPATGSNQLEVFFRVDETSMDRVAGIHEALMSVRGLLRSAVAGAIHRKRVPQLNFTVLPDRDSTELE